MQNQLEAELETKSHPVLGKVHYDPEVDVGLTFNLAVDFDRTITLNPHLFARMMSMFVNAGCEVKIVTSRVGTLEDICEIESFLEKYNLINNVDIIFCEMVPKKLKCKELGWKPDVWMDNYPVSIDNDVFNRLN